MTVRNLVAIPVAGGLFAHGGFDLPMSLRAIAMIEERLIVAANAQLLRRLKLVGESSPIGRPMHAAV